MATSVILDPNILKAIMDFIQTTVNEEGQVTISDRVIKYSAKGRVHSLREPWVYDGTAWDVMSGISEKAKHYRSRQGAIEHAMLKLFERLKKDGIM